MDSQESEVGQGHHHVENSLEEYVQTLQQDFETVSAELCPALLSLRNEIEDLKGKLEAAGKENDELRRQKENCKIAQGSLKQDITQKHDEILSLNGNIQSLQAEVAELQQISHVHQSKGKPSRDADIHERQSASCGSYADESATPVHLHNALSHTKTAVSRFQKNFVEAIQSNHDVASVAHLLCPGAYFARRQHVAFAVKAAIYDAFFEGFENESFYCTFSGCSRGASPFLDPDLRISNFYELYLRKREEQNDRKGIEDPQFEEFCERKISAVWNKLNLGFGSNNEGKKITCLQELGVPLLASSFRIAANSVWLLHMLAFSFEPPASLFRVLSGADVDLNYMNPVVSLEDSTRFVPKVGFMIVPGLRLRKTVLRSEVYLAGKGCVANE